MVTNVTRYSLMRRRQLDASQVSALNFDLFISAFDATDRVRDVFGAVNATSKHWLLHDEYEFRSSQSPSGGQVFSPGTVDEAEFWLSYFEQAGVDLGRFSSDLTLCVDATGFLRPHLMVLLALARRAGMPVLNVLYADPLGYRRAEKTAFSGSVVTEVRQIRGFEGVHEATPGDSDLLLIGAGYDDQLISRIAESKRAAHKIQIFGLPSLRPHMYQESRLRASRAEESIGPYGSRDILFAPASNPFVTADVLSSAVSDRRRSGAGASNIYLSALGTKPQVLGFALFHLLELQGSSASVIFPFTETYKTETAYGLSRVWHYELVLI